MWELIRKNRRKSLFLFFILGSILLLTGYLIGSAVIMGEGGYVGIAIAFAIWIIWSAVSYFSGNAIIMKFSHARKVDHSVHPQLFNVVEEMKIAANLPAMPSVYIIDDPAPNAFATGRSPKKSAIAVTAGLLNRLNRTELQGVIAHEVSHILNRDTMYMTFAGIMLGTITLISHGFLRGLWFSGGATTRYRSKKMDRSGSNQYMLIIAVIFAVLAPILSRMFYFSISRKREYLADASAVRLTRYPEGLASALEKISSFSQPVRYASSTTAPMFITNPLKSKKSKKQSFSSLFATHPPVKNRISVLRKLTHGVNYLNYQSAITKVLGKGVLPGSCLQDKTTIAPRPKPPEEAAKIANKRELGDLIRAVNGFIFLTCVCGLKMKLPPGFKQPKIDCPKCKRVIPLPLAKIAALSAVITQSKGLKKVKEEALKKKTPRKITHKRQGTGWETIQCTCGARKQLSPNFAGSKVKCIKCNNTIEIV